MRGPLREEGTRVVHSGPADDHTPAAMDEWYDKTFLQRVAQARLALSRTEDDDGDDGTRRDGRTEDEDDDWTDDETDGTGGRTEDDNGDGGTDTTRRDGQTIYTCIYIYIYLRSFKYNIGTQILVS